jgi:putative transposase
MKKYRKGSHTVYDNKYHLVWITKYRKPVLGGLEAVRIRELIREICINLDVEILSGNVRKDHIHLFVSVPPSVSISALMQAIKGKTSYKMLSESEKFRKMFWGKHLWARGYFSVTSGNITDEAIMEYVLNQDLVEQQKDKDFKVWDE